MALTLKSVVFLVVFLCFIIATNCFVQPSFARHSLKSKAISATPLDSLVVVNELPKLAVILVDHGSRKAEANDMLVELAIKYKNLYKIEIVEAAHMELSEPSIKTAFRKCVEQGAKKIICHPFFLSKGRHVQEDIPEMMRAAAAEHSNIDLEYSVTEPLGLQDKILDLVHNSVTISMFDAKILK
jgi:sirohydrochlorin ferrochelatase